MSRIWSPGLSSDSLLCFGYKSLPFPCHGAGPLQRGMPNSPLPLTVWVQGKAIGYMVAWSNYLKYAHEPNLGSLVWSAIKVSDQDRRTRSGIKVQDQVPGTSSGTKFRDQVPGSSSGIKVQGQVPGSSSGIKVQGQGLASTSRIKVRDQG